MILIQGAVMKKLKKWIGITVLIAFSTQNLLSSSYAVASINFDQPQPLHLPSLKIDKSLGRIESVYQGEDSRTIVLIQDAHAEFEAQIAIQKLIEQFVNTRQINLIGVEGAEGELEKDLLASYPDSKTLSLVIQEFMEKDGLSGAVAASVLDASEADYVGLENTKLYHESVYAFLRALPKRELLLKKWAQKWEKLEAEKQKTYSSTLKELDFLLTKMEEGGGHQSFENLLHFLSARKFKINSKKHPTLYAFQTELTKNEKNEAEIKKCIKKLENLGMSAHLNKKTIQMLQSHKQDYQIGNISDLDYLHCLTIIAENSKLQKADIQTAKLILESRKYVHDLKPADFLLEVESFSKEVKNTFFKKSQEKKLQQRTETLLLERKLIQHSLSYQEWKKIRSKEFAHSKDFEDHRAFYDNAEKRDEILFQNALKIMKAKNQNQMILVVGGFHTQGLAEHFRKQNISYAVMTPAFKNISSENHYSKLMQGKVTWADEFVVRKGSVDLYASFMNATIKRLMKALRSNYPNLDKRYFLKNWQNSLYEKLAIKNEIEKASEFQPFLELAVNRLFTQDELEQVKKNWMKRVNFFLKGLEKLKLKQNVNIQSITELLHSSTAISLTGIVFSIPTVSGSKYRMDLPLSTSGRSEVRRPRNYKYHLLEGVGSFEKDEHLRERNPNWQRMNVLGQIIINEHERTPQPVSLDNIKELALKKWSGQGILATGDTVELLLERLVELKLLKKSEKGYEPAVTRQILSIKTNHIRFIHKEFDIILQALMNGDLGAKIHLKNLLKDYYGAYSSWPQYPVEAGWPVLKAVSLLDKSKQKALLSFIQSLDPTDFNVLADMIEGMLRNGSKVKDWLKKNAKEIIGRTVYYVSPETWYAAGGLGRVGQYHTIAIKEAMKGDADIVTIEPYYPYRLDKDGQPVSLDYSQLSVPINGLANKPEFEFKVLAKKGDSRKETTVQVFKGRNKYGIITYFIKDIPEIDGEEPYYVKLLYRYGKEYGAATLEEFSEFLSKASLKLIKRLEKISKNEKKQSYKTPVIWGNDGQLGPLAAFKRVSDKLESLSLDQQEQVRKNPHHDLYEFRDLIQEPDEELIEGAYDWFTTHTFKNTIRTGWETIDGMGFKGDLRGYFSRINQNGYGTHADFTNAGNRAADGVNGVAAMHVQGMAHVAPETEKVAITNGDDLQASSKFFRFIFLSKDDQSKLQNKSTDREIRNLTLPLDFQNLEDFQKIFPGADPEYPTPEQVVEAKKRVKVLLRAQQNLIVLDPEFQNIDPASLTFIYTGRLVEEKAGLKRAFTRGNIQKIINAGGTVIHLGNVQAGADSLEMFKGLRELQKELNKPNQKGRLIVATGWNLPEQRMVLAAGDVQINDSDEVSEASGLTETDIGVNAGIEVSLPTPEGIYQQQGEILDWNEPGSGNTVIASSYSEEGYEEVIENIIQKHRRSPLALATYQAVSVRMSQILNASLTGRAYLRQFNGIIRRRENVIETMVRYANGDDVSGEHFRSEWLRQSLISQLRREGKTLKTEELKVTNPEILAFARPNTSGSSTIDIVVVESGIRYDGSNNNSGIIEPNVLSEIVGGLNLLEGQKISVVDAVTGAQYGSYGKDELLERGLYVEVPRNTHLQILKLKVAVTEVSENESTNHTLFYSAGLSAVVSKRVLSLVPGGLFSQLNQKDTDIVWWTPSEGFSPKGPLQWSDEGFYLIVHKGDGKLSITLSKNLSHLYNVDDKLSNSRKLDSNYFHVSLRLAGKDLFIESFSMDSTIQIGGYPNGSSNPQFIAWFKDNLLEFAKTHGVSTVYAAKNVFEHQTLMSAGFAKTPGTNFYKFEVTARSELRLAEIETISNLVLGIGLTDAGAEIVLQEGNRKLVTRLALAKLVNLLPTFKKMGIGKIYLYGGLYQHSETGVSDKTHTVPDTNTHFITSANETVMVRVENYLTKRSQIDDWVLEDGVSPFSILSMLLFNPDLTDSENEKGTSEKTKEALSYLIGEAKRLNISVIVDFIPWLSPDAISEKNLNWTFTRKITDEQLAIYRSKTEPERVAYIQEVLFPQHGDCFALRLNKGKADESVVFVRHLQHGIALLDETILNPFAPEVMDYYKKAFEQLIDLGVEGVRGDVLWNLLKEKLKDYVTEFTYEKHRWTQAHEKAEEPLKELMQHVFNYAASKNQKFQFIFEVYDERYQQILINIAKSLGHENDVLVYNEKVFDAMEQLKNGGSAANLLEVLKKVVVATPGTSFIFPSNYDQTPIQLTKAQLVLFLLFAYFGKPLKEGEHYPLEIFLILRNLLNATGNPFPVPGGDIHPEVGTIAHRTPNTNARNAHPHPGTLEELNVWTDQIALRKYLENSNWNETLSEVQSIIGNHSQNWLQILPNSNPDRYVSFAWRDEEGQWKVFAADLKPHLPSTKFHFNLQFEELNNSLGNLLTLKNLEGEVFTVNDGKVFLSFDQSRDYFFLDIISTESAFATSTNLQPLAARAEVRIENPELLIEGLIEGLIGKKANIPVLTSIVQRSEVRHIANATTRKALQVPAYRLLLDSREEQNFRAGNPNYDSETARFVGKFLNAAQRKAITVLKSDPHQTLNFAFSYPFSSAIAGDLLKYFEMIQTLQSEYSGRVSSGIQITASDKQIAENSGFFEKAKQMPTIVKIVKVDSIHNTYSAHGLEGFNPVLYGYGLQSIALSRQLTFIDLGNVTPKGGLPAAFIISTALAFQSRLNAEEVSAFVQKLLQGKIQSENGHLRMRIDVLRLVTEYATEKIIASMA